MRRRQVRSAALAIVAALALTVPAPAADEARTAHAHRTIHATPEAQAQFDAGLAMLWAFSIGEARRRFRAAATVDPECAMCRWGEALSETTDINYAQSEAGDARGATAITDAQRRATDAPPDERALIDALALRFAPGKSAQQHFTAYADAMDRYVGAHPDDATALDAAAYARWLATDNALDHATHQPTAGARVIERDLDRAIAVDPDDLGAHHLRIHLEEDFEHPAAALPDAQLFDATTFPPGMSHLPHMAGHIYARLGMWTETIAANERALANDDAYVALGEGDGWKYLSRYHFHDADFVAYALTALGRSDDARREMEAHGDLLRAEVALRSGDGAGVLRRAAAADGAQFAALRAIALARTHDIVHARALLPAAAKANGAWGALARAAVARAAGDQAAELRDLAAAREAVAGAPGDPKSAWADPPGEAEGAAFLRAGRYVDAERVFSEECARFPNDPRLEFGLAEALHAGHHDDAAARATARRLWRGPHPLSRDDLA